MGYRTIAIARGPERAQAAAQLGAEHYIDSNAQAPGEALADLGGADLIISTVPTSEPVTGLLPGLAAHGRLTLVGVDAGSLTVPVGQLVSNAQSVGGHLTGSTADTEEAMNFAQLNGIKPIVERMPLTAANEALSKIAAGQPGFRIVLDPQGA